MTVKVGELTPNDKGWPCGFAHVGSGPEAPFLVTLNGWENAACREHAAQLHPELFGAGKDVFASNAVHTARQYAGPLDCTTCPNRAEYTVESNTDATMTLIPVVTYCATHMRELFPTLVPPVVESSEPAWGDVDFLAYDADKSCLMICPTTAKYRNGHPNVMLTCGKDTMDAEAIYNGYRRIYPDRWGQLGNTWWRDKTLNVWRCEILPAT